MRNRKQCYLSAILVRSANYLIEAFAIAQNGSPERSVQLAETTEQLRTVTRR